MLLTLLQLPLTAEWTSALKGIDFIEKHYTQDYTEIIQKHLMGIKELEQWPRNIRLGTSAVGILHL